MTKHCPVVRLGAPPAQCSGGEFLSLLEPPDLYTADAQACINTGVSPILAGDEPDRSILLLSPSSCTTIPKPRPRALARFGMMRQPGHRFFFGPEEIEPYKEDTTT
jgi:hypothetical protein